MKQYEYGIQYNKKPDDENSRDVIRERGLTKEQAEAYILWGEHCGMRKGIFSIIRREVSDWEIVND